ncbi:MAG: hypothetical protein U0003_04085 [Vampirovibrionales bacterium]
MRVLFSSFYRIDTEVAAQFKKSANLVQRFQVTHISEPVGDTVSIRVPDAQDVDFEAYLKNQGKPYRWDYRLVEGASV